MKHTINSIIQPRQKLRFWEIVVWKASEKKRPTSCKVLSRRFLKVGRVAQISEPVANNYPTLHKEDGLNPMDEVNRQAAP